METHLDSVIIRTSSFKVLGNEFNFEFQKILRKLHRFCQTCKHEYGSGILVEPQADKQYFEAPVTKTNEPKGRICGNRRYGEPSSAAV